jgi:hypothetical protein
MNLYSVYSWNTLNASVPLRGVHGMDLCGLPNMQTEVNL